MAVYYRYRSGVDTFSLPLDTPSISVRDLKHLIVSTVRHGLGRREEAIAISNARTGHEYIAADSMVPCDSTVVVRRLPSGGDDTAMAVRAKKEDSPEVAKAISAAAELEWEEMTRCITTAGKQTAVGSSATEAPAPAPAWEDLVVGHCWYWPRPGPPAYLDRSRMNCSCCS